MDRNVQVEEVQDAVGGGGGRESWGTISTIRPVTVVLSKKS
jgi:hypothetical protein